MKFTELKKGQKVYDRWFGDFGTGVVLKVLKTRVHVHYSGTRKPLIYDRAHVQFLELEK